MEREVTRLQQDALETILDSRKRREIQESKENEKRNQGILKMSEIMLQEFFDFAIYFTFFFFHEHDGFY